ncbi:hypothetical protein WA026_001855 [Henosepilachna vigintioctopunctata]|uniref:Zinc finger HIT domain-containing protein n=1 Tax=Henosepilachna vigintioctopunctata TaxID=420089 RepID=A0AAW1UKU3_9CUCU
MSLFVKINSSSRRLLKSDCSKFCYAKHKDNCVPKKTSKYIEATKGTIMAKSKIQHRDLIPINKLESLRNENRLHQLLKNPHLKDLLKTINNSKNPEEVMQKAMQEPLFTEFADVCFNKLEPQSND